MQLLARLSVNGVGGPYSGAQVMAAMTAPVVTEQWKYDLLSAQGQYIADLSPYVNRDTAPEVTHDTTQNVHRGFSALIRGDAPLGTLSQLIRVHYQLSMPDGGVADFVLGTFTLTPSQDTIAPTGTWRQVTAPDLGQLLVDGGFTSSYGVPAGAGYIAAIRGIVNSLGAGTTINVLIPDLGQTLPAPLSWDLGATRLKAVNDLLKAINYFPAWFDEMGTMRSAPIPDWRTVSPSVVFDSTQQSFVWEQFVRQPDIYSIYNIFVVKCEDSRRNAFYGQYENKDPASPISTKNWHPKVQTWTDSSIADPATANAAARTAAQASARALYPTHLSTFAWPASQDNDVVQLVLQSKDEPLTDYNYVQTYWLHRCGPGLGTDHILERITAA